MNKILRISMIAVLALIANFSFGQAYKTLTFPDDNKATNKVGAFTTKHGLPKLVLTHGQL